MPRRTQTSENARSARIAGRPKPVRPQPTLNTLASEPFIAIGLIPEFLEESTYPTVGLAGSKQAVLGGVSYRLLRRVLGRDCGSATKPAVIMRNAKPASPIAG